MLNPLTNDGELKTSSNKIFRMSISISGKDIVRFLIESSIYLTHTHTLL